MSDSVSSEHAPPDHAPADPVSPDSLSGGLSQARADALLASEGPNELPGMKKRSLFGTIFDVLREPMLLLLIGAGAIYLVLGELRDALILLAFTGLSVIITIVQQSRTERAIDALRDLSMPHATVIRDGVRKQIPSRELVRGDLMVVSEGIRIAADGWVEEASALQADEAILTGESVAVSKVALSGASADELPLPGGDALPYAFSGTLVVRGTGHIRVAATGARSQIGRIGQSLASLETETPRLTLQTRKLVRWFAAFGITVSLLAVVLYGVLRGGWLEALLSGIAIAMSMLPEELPIVLTLFMTMGAFRMSRARVLTRRGTAIETLGAATVLCVDKTGTLTENRMEIVELRRPDGQCCCPDDTPDGLPDEMAGLARLGLLACLEEPFDPMEQAFHDLARDFLHDHPGMADCDDPAQSRTLQRQYPLSPDLLAMTHVWAREGSDDKLVAAKGAPEAIAQLCALDEAERQMMDAQIGEMARRGLRVLGVAEARWQGDGLPGSQREFAFAYRGLIGLADPIRDTVPAAVKRLQAAGIRIIMMTGDYPATASAIAAQAGISGNVMTGDDIARLDDDGLAKAISDVGIFARVMPEQKLRLIRALKTAGEVVAMTGDGVNDGPSLKAAHIGIAMGKRGTDVAREASAIVLLDDDFATIVSAVLLGRRIYDNLRKATGFIFAVHLPIGGLAIAPLLTGWPLILGPVHIALLEMVVDPMSSLAFEAEPEEPDTMRRPPRHPDSPLISRSLLTWAGVQGATALLMLLGLAAWANGAGWDDKAVRAICYAGLIVAVLSLVFTNRTFRPAPNGSPHKHNVPMIVISALLALIFSAVFFIPSVADLLRLTVLESAGLWALGIYAVALLVALSLVKRFFRDALIR